MFQETWEGLAALGTAGGVVVVIELVTEQKKNSVKAFALPHLLPLCLAQPHCFSTHTFGSFYALSPTAYRITFG
jgi:hypothetical protein